MLAPTQKISAHRWVSRGFPEGFQGVSMGFQGFPGAGIAKAVPKSNGFSKEVTSGQGFPGGLAWPNYNIKRSNGEIRVRLGCGFESVARVRF